jgi:hypothetical protein
MAVEPLGVTCFGRPDDLPRHGIYGSKANCAMHHVRLEAIATRRVSSDHHARAQGRRAAAFARVTEPSVVPAALVWALLGIVAVEIVVTYARVPPDELYHVSGSGIVSGFGRALVYLNFPVALAALPLVALAADRLRGRPALVAVAIVSAGLCAVVFWPGVVDPADLDRKPINALPALGVGLALLLTAVSGLFRVRARVHPAVVVFSMLLLLLAIPWIAAELGFYLDGVPVLGRLFLTGTIYEGHASVHHGHHHGMDGVLLTLTALAAVPLVRRAHLRPLRITVGIYLGLQLAYGLGNAVNDGWLEQLVKRGWVDTEIPSVLEPAISLAWLGIVLAALLFSLPVLQILPHGHGLRHVQRY